MRKNFVKAIVSTGYNASATTIVLASGGGAKMPSTPFVATWWDSTTYPDPADDPNVEVITVGSVSSDTLSSIATLGTHAAARTLWLYMDVGGTLLMRSGPQGGSDPTATVAAHHATLRITKIVNG